MREWGGRDRSRCGASDGSSSLPDSTTTPTTATPTARSHASLHLSTMTPPHTFHHSACLNAEPSGFSLTVQSAATCPSPTCRTPPSITFILPLPSSGPSVSLPCCCCRRCCCLYCCRFCCFFVIVVVVVCVVAVVIVVGVVVGLLCYNDSVGHKICSSFFSPVAMQYMFKAQYHNTISASSCGTLRCNEVLCLTTLPYAKQSRGVD